MNENDDSEVTVVAPTPLTDAEAWWHKWKKDGDTEAWLMENVPTAHAWWRLWVADQRALAIAVDAAEALPPSSRDRITTEHGAAERSASLWYLSELLRAEHRTLTALAAHDAPSATVERLTAVLGRIQDLAREVRAVTAP